MTAWQELVTTALLGTDRRPVPDDLPAAVARLAAAEGDPARAVLDAAAALSARRHAGVVPGHEDAPAAAPRQSVDFAPEGAQWMLAHVLSARDTVLADLWLQHCAERGLGVRPRLWCPLATAAASPRGVDRALVRAALGARGCAFLSLRPEWQVVLRAAPGRSRADPDPTDPDLTDPTVLAALPGPWTEEVAAAALRHVDDGALPSSVARRLAVALALRAPLTVRDDVQRMPYPDAVRALAARLDIARSFDEPDQEPP